jgi:hypothetical protein
MGTNANLEKAAKPAKATIICIIRQRPDLKGWEIEANQLQHNSWFLTVSAALGYARFRTRGHFAEVQVINSLGDCIQSIEMDQRDWDDGLKFPHAGGMGDNTNEKTCQTEVKTTKTEEQTN